MAKNPDLWLILALLSVQFFGCDQALQPNAPFQKRLVVYAVLTNRSDTQFARVYTSYPSEGDTPGADSARYGMLDAILTIRQGSNIYQFLDTLVLADSVKGGPVWVRARVAHGLTPSERLPYDLAVSSPSLGTARSSLIYLAPGRLTVANAESLFLPSAVDRFPVAVTLSADAAAYIVRFTLEYEVLTGGVWRPARVEVPLGRETSAGAAQGNYIYPSLMARGQLSDVALEGRAGVVFPGWAYRGVLAQLRDTYGGTNLRFRNAVFTLTQVNLALYAYYSTANAFFGAATLRLDEPDYSNIQGGLGVFGAIRDDADTLRLSTTLDF
jgi:hypothetical protein